MMLGDGFGDVPAGKLAAVVTSLEMSALPPVDDLPMRADLAIERRDAPALDWYRGLFRRIGEPWLWVSRLKLADAALTHILHDPDVEVYRMVAQGGDIGLLELDFRTAGACELAFFGLAPEMVGTGAGRELMRAAVARAFARPVTRFWVHTCTLDHPAALAFYMRAGFQPFRRQVEVFDDPRVTGLLPRAAAPQIPVI